MTFSLLHVKACCRKWLYTAFLVMLAYLLLRLRRRPVLNEQLHTRNMQYMALV